jgi:hypothetical protein
MSNDAQNVKPDLKIVPPETPKAWDPFDPESLKAQGRGDEIAVEKVLLAVAVRKPRKGEFFRVHPDPDLSAIIKVFKSDDGDTYLVNPVVQDVFGQQVVTVRLFYCVNRYGDPFLWPVRVPTNGEKDNSYWETARAAAAKAVDDWFRIEANLTAKNYAATRAQGALPAPAWPELPYPEVLQLAFKNAVVDNRDHTLVRTFLGEI